jgi:hypothetical protein
MSSFEMGRVSAFLLKHRKVEEKSDRRTIPREERDIAELLREAPVDSARFLEELMNGYGFGLTTLTSYDIAGIPLGAKVTLLPVALAGMLYLGSGLGLLAWQAARALIRRDGQDKPAGLAARDLPWLAGAILAGGIAGLYC